MRLIVDLNGNNVQVYENQNILKNDLFDLQMTFGFLVFIAAIWCLKLIFSKRMFKIYVSNVVFQDLYFKTYLSKLMFQNLYFKTSGFCSFGFSKLSIVPINAWKNVKWWWGRARPPFFWCRRITARVTIPKVRRRLIRELIWKYPEIEMQLPSFKFARDKSSPGLPKVYPCMD